MKCLLGPCCQVLRILMVTIGSLRVYTSALHGSVLERPHFTTLIHSGLCTVSEACLSLILLPLGEIFLTVFLAYSPRSLPNADH